MSSSSGEILGGKKRKVSSGKNTVQISQESGMEAEEKAAKYMERLKQSDPQNFKRISSVEKRTTGKGGTEVKISFGPSRPPSKQQQQQQQQQQNHTSAAAAASMAAMMGGQGASVSFGDLDLEALKEKAAAAAAGQKNFRNKHGLPCTEAEMKALMSMFVEIMGMSMNNPPSNNNHKDSKKNPSHNNNNGSPVFSFGANPMDASSLAAMAAAASGSSSAGMLPDHMAAATAGFFADGASWEALRRTYAAAEQMAAAEDDDDEDDDDLDDEESFENRELTFEEVEFLLHHRKQKEEAAKLASQFASGDWESLEQVAINDHLLSSEADDKERRAAKKREKKQRRKAKLKEEAAQKAAEAAQKKREKAIVSWRSRVVSACQSNEVSKLDGLLHESPLRKLMEEDSNTAAASTIDENDAESHLSTACIIPHLEFLLPNSVAKNRAHVERGIEARLRLAEYVLQNELLLAFKPLRTGRTALHTACFHGDVRFLQLLFDKIELYDGKDPLPTSFLDLTCDESGWSPLHYAAVSGCSDVLELLLSKGSNLSTRTDVTHTWRESDGKGLTPRELVQCVQAGNYEKIIETHGLALQEMTNAFFGHHQERRGFLKKLERVYQRLSGVEKNGYTPPISSKDRADSITESEAPSETPSNDNPSESTSSKNKKKKKKKKKKDAESSNAAAAATQAESPKNTSAAVITSNPTEVEEKEDPLVTALLGMGFNETQIKAAVKACGGTHRATADDLVTWILGQGDSDETPNDGPTTSSFDDNRQDTFTLKNVEPPVVDDYVSVPGSKAKQQQKLEAARQQEEAARRLAAKREEARRRNREWNNREQARQVKEKEAKAKVAQKVLGASRPTVPVSHSRMPNGISAAAVAAPTIPVSVFKTSPRQPKLAVGTPDLTTGNKWGVPPPVAAAPPRSFAGPPTATGKHSKNAKTKISSAIPTTNESQSLPVTSFFANDDDKTVSSFGSNRGISVSSKEFAPQPTVPPPGFLPTPAQPISAPTRLPVATVPEDASSGPTYGEIRATAKAFVPSFTISGSGTNTGSLSNEFVPSNELGGGPSDGVGFPPGILPQHGGSSVGHTSLLGSGLSNSFDKTHSIGPVAVDTLVPGTSLLSGAKMEEPPMSIPFGFGPADSAQESNDIGGSRLLNSFSRNVSAGNPSSIWGETPGIPSLETTLQPSFFGDGITGDDEENHTSWGMSGGSNSGLPNNSRQGSIW